MPPVFSKISHVNVNWDVGLDYLALYHLAKVVDESGFGLYLQCLLTDDMIERFVLCMSVQYVAYGEELVDVAHEWPPIDDFELLVVTKLVALIENTQEHPDTISESPAQLFRPPPLPKLWNGGTSSVDTAILGLVPDSRSVFPISQETDIAIFGLDANWTYGVGFIHPESGTIWPRPVTIENGILYCIGDESILRAAELLGDPRTMLYHMNKCFNMNDNIRVNHKDIINHIYLKWMIHLVKFDWNDWKELIHYVRSGPCCLDLVKTFTQGPNAQYFNWCRVPRSWLELGTTYLLYSHMSDIGLIYEGLVPWSDKFYD